MDAERQQTEAYASLRRRRESLEHRILELERALAGAKAEASVLAPLAAARAELVEVLDTLRRFEDAEHDPNVVEMWDTVTVRRQGSSEEEPFTIVGSVEARANESWISSDSPLGTALLGRKAGDTVTVEAPAGTVRYRVVSIERS